MLPLAAVRLVGSLPSLRQAHSHALEVGDNRTSLDAVNLRALREQAHYRTYVVYIIHRDWPTEQFSPRPRGSRFRFAAVDGLIIAECRGPHRVACPVSTACRHSRRRRCGGWSGRTTSTITLFHTRYLPINGSGVECDPQGLAGALACLTA